MQGGVTQPERGGGVGGVVEKDGAAQGTGDGAAPGEVIGGERTSGLGQGIGRSLEDDVTAGFAMARAEIDEMIGGAHDGGFVFHNDDGIPEVTQTLEDGDEALGIARMQSDAGFVEDIQGVDETRPEAGGEVDAFGFAA